MAVVLSERVAFDAPTLVQDGAGGQVRDWTQRHHCPAHLRYLRGSETVIAARLAGRQPVVATIRICTAARAIGTDWQMRDMRRDVTYGIKAIVPTDDRLYLELTCETVPT